MALIFSSAINRMCLRALQAAYRPCTRVDQDDGQSFPRSLLDFSLQQLQHQYQIHYDIMEFLFYRTRTVTMSKECADVHLELLFYIVICH